MNNKIKKISIFLIGIIVLFLSIIPTYAASDVLTADGIGADLNVYNPSDTPSTETISSKAGMILEVIQTIGAVLSVIILIVVGIKYMISSVEEKAEYKKTFMYYVIGVFLLFTGTLLPKIIYDLSTGVFD